MNLQVLQEKFSESLSIASRFANPRAQLPVLGNILLLAKGNKLLINATNLELSISMSIGAKIKKEGEITIPAKTISDLVSNLAKGQITLSSEKEKLKILSQNFSSSVSGMNASDFPSVPSEIGKKTIIFSNSEFSKAIANVLFAASIDETRPILTGILMIFDENKLTFVATDGFRLSKKVMKIKLLKSIDKLRLILPKNALSELLRLSKEEENIKLSLKKEENQVLFGVDKAVLSSRVLEGEFPDFEKIIPKESIVSLRMDKEELLRAVKLASVFARDAANVVKLSIGKDSLEISAQSSQSGSQKMRVDAKVDGNTKNIKIAFNYRFLEDFLNSIEGDEVEVELGDSSSPGVFTDPKDKDFLHLIMPVRIQD